MKSEILNDLMTTRIIDQSLNPGAYSKPTIVIRLVFRNSTCWSILFQEYARVDEKTKIFEK